MLRRSLRALVAACAISACATPSSNLRVYAPPAPPTVEQTLADLSRVRSLPLDAPVQIETVDDDAFLRALHAMNDRASPRRRPGDGAFWSTFTMAGASTDVTAMAQRMADENLVGFYDPHAKRLYVRHHLGPATGGSSERLTLAHEVEHALQDRFFGIPDFTTLADADEGLALHALLEGDAMVASIVLEGTRQGSTSAEVVARMARLSDDDPLVIQASGVIAPKDAPPLLRAELSWPYTRGTMFVARLAASGGWALVNAAMRSPPKTTEQVLHIEKYVAGEGPIEVRTPAAPAGYTLVETGRMGELRTRFLLAECTTDEAAAEAAAGWGGDAYAIGVQGGDRALLWATAWDDENAAQRFAAALESRRACARTGAKPPFTVVRDGTRVAFVQGLPEEATRRAAGAKLVSLVGRVPPPVPPLGQVELRARPPVSTDFARRGVAGGGKFVDPPLGLASDLTGLTPTRGDALELHAVGDHVRVAVTFSWGAPSEALADAFTASFVEGLRAKAPAEKVLSAGASRIPLSWTTADARSLRVGDRIDVRIVLAPACHGKMTIVLVATSEQGTVGSAIADAWLRSVTATESSPACEALGTLRDPSDETR
jgi:hypothetical protein